MKIYFYTNILFLFLFIISLACTNNPFGNDKISSDSQTIRGTVNLQYDTPEGVYVWLEGFNIGTYTNNNGNFELNLPSPTRFSNLTGNFNLYFYVANYNIDTANVVIHNGEVKYSLGDLDDNGQLCNEIYLAKMLHIKLVAKEINIEAIPFNDLYKVALELSFRAENELVSVEFPNKSDGPLSIVFIKRFYPDDNFLEMVYLNDLALESPMAIDHITNKPKEWVGSFNKKTLQLTKGKYKIIPYTIIHQPHIPEELLKIFLKDKNNPTVDFINLPIKIEDGIFETIR